MDRFTMFQKVNAQLQTIKMIRLPLKTNLIDKNDSQTRNVNKANRLLCYTA
jgi:hypothetical protein